VTLRYLADFSEKGPELISLDSAETHHLVHVMRAVPGADITLMTGQGTEAHCEFVALSGKQAELRVRKFIHHSRPELSTVLALPLLKSQKMEWVVQKAVELGVHTIVPLSTEHTVVQLKNASKESRRLERWNRIACSAIKQSGNPWLPLIKHVSSLADFLADTSSRDALLLASLADNARPLSDVLTGLSSTTCPRIAVLIGPEGDFSENEYHNILQAGAQPVTLGTNTLRSETAAIYLLSVLQYTANLWATEAAMN